MESWDDLKYLLAVSRAGSLVGAARMLSVDATTVGRRLTALERALGTQLVLRGIRTMSLTARAEPVLDRARAIAELVQGLEEELGQGDRAVAGSVRLTTLDELASFPLAARAPELLDRHPQLDLQLIAGPEVLDLRQRQADVALRLAPPEGEALIIRKVAELGFAWYASERYLRENGTPSGRLVGHRVLLWEPSAAPPKQWAAVLKSITESRVVLRSNRSATLREAAASGLGIALLPCITGDRDDRLRRIGAVLGHRPLWWVVHKNMQRVARIRAVSTWAIGVLKEAQAALAGRA